MIPYDGLRGWTLGVYVVVFGLLCKLNSRGIWGVYALAFGLVGTIIVVIVIIVRIIVVIIRYNHRCNDCAHRHLRL